VRQAGFSGFVPGPDISNYTLYDGLVRFLLAHGALSVSRATQFAICVEEAIVFYFLPPSVQVAKDPFHGCLCLQLIYTPLRKTRQGGKAIKLHGIVQLTDSVEDKNEYFFQGRARHRTETRKILKM